MHPHLNLNDIVNKLRPVLEEYQKERALLEEQITQQGRVLSSLCHKCQRKSIHRVRKLEDLKQQVAGLLEWMQTNDVRELKSGGEILSFKSTKKFVGQHEGTFDFSA